MITSSIDLNAATLSKTGFSIFSLSTSNLEHSFNKIVNEIGMPRYHPHANTNGVTRIETRKKIAGHSTLAFSSGELKLHTDGSAVQEPPKYVALACLRQCRSGGYSLFSDGWRALAFLRRKHPEHIEVLSEKKNFVFGHGNEAFNAPIIDLSGPSPSVRFRQDVGLRATADAEKSLRVFAETLEHFQIVRRLRKGEAYIVDNHRWLHGRSAYKGARVMLRLLFD